jgi:hypothetical protein
MLKQILCLSLLFPFTVHAQQYAQYGYENDSQVHYDLSAMGIGTSNGHVPFWMRTNSYGSMPLDGASGGLLGSVRKEYVENEVEWSNKKIDWGGGAEVRLNAGNKIEAQFITAYLKAKYRIFQIQVGRSKDIMGLVDSSLSSGAFAVSGNALGIPKIEISIPDYWTIPILDGMISIKGNFALGYIGNMETVNRPYNFARQVDAYYHQKSFYGRLGKESWRLKFYGGFNHQVMWGQENKYLGPAFNLSPVTTMLYAITGKVYGNSEIPYSKIGNHIGSLDQAVSYEFNNMVAKVYHQFFYDVGGLFHLNNIKDGLWGLSFENTQEEKGDFYWRKILIEVLNSKSQGGELDAKITPSGDENYYNNYVYYKGWTYKNENIGNNFLTNKEYIRKELPEYKNEYIGNNRVTLVHMGIEWQAKDWSITNKFSFSRNYGTYATSPIGNSLGAVRTIQPPPYFTSVNQFSGYIEASRALKNNFRIGFVLAGDYGDLLYNSIGGMVKLTKSW